MVWTWCKMQNITKIIVYVCRKADPFLNLLKVNELQNELQKCTSSNRPVTYYLLNCIFNQLTEHFKLSIVGFPLYYVHA